MRYRILNAESRYYSKKAGDILGKIAEVDYFDSLSASRIKRKISRYDGLIVRLRNYIGRDILKNAEKLLFIATAATGLDHIDAGFAGKKSIRILSLGGEKRFLLGVYATAEYTFALILALTRNIPSAFIDVRRGRWDRYEFIGSELNGKTLGIIGFGRVGRMVAGYAGSFGMDVVACDIVKNGFGPRVKRVSLNELLEVSDIISVHLPLNKDTEGILGKASFNKMAKRPFIVNTSRGAIIDEPALLAALKKSLVRGAAIDVVKGEYRIGKKNTALLEYAKTHGNLVITPHIAGASRESMEKTEVFIANEIVRYLKNRKDDKA